MFALALALMLAVAPPAPAQQTPERVYQPKVFEPGLDGGKNGYFAHGEFTPDGRVLIAFRRLEDSTSMPPVMRYALTASLTHPDRLVPDGDHLESFYNELASPTSQQYGTNFTFGAATEAPSEWVRIHWGHEVIPCAPFSGDCIQPCGLVQNPAYPGSDTFGAAHMSVTLREPSGNAVSNPFPSHVNGTYSANGDYTTYDLWIVRTHWSQPLTCSTGSTGLVQWSSVPSGTDTTPVLAAQNVRVVIDEVNQTITSAEVLMSGNDYFEPLVVAATGNNIRGIEPTLTADGRLLLYHGAGNLAMASAGHAVVTYSYNSTGSIATGWSEPRSITELPSSIELNGLSPQDFKDRYRLFQKLPTMTNNSGGGTFQFAMGDNVPGTYPWVSKDGSFYNAYSVRATEAFETLPGGAQVSSNKIKVGAYVVGDLTNWTIKHIDSAALNPTRLGGPWLWPRHLTSPINSWGAMTMSAGVKPGRWQPLLEQGGALFPTMSASQRIPILPLFLPVIDTYGEVRFEGADGNYLLYLACNEAFDIHTAPSPTVTSKPFTILPKSTPDSSGRDTSALCELNIGAAFPQEVYTNSSSTATALRQAIGGELFEPPVALFHPFHENVGFKGQAIVFNSGGAIDVTELERLGSASEWTVQCFVKFVSPAFVDGTPTTSLFEYGLNVDGLKIPGIILDVDAQGIVRGRVRVSLTAPLVNVSTSNALTNNETLANRTEGWHHVTLTYATDTVADSTTLRIFLDGGLENEVVIPQALNMLDVPAYPAYVTVGPGTSGTASEIKLNDALLILDEVALSNIERTDEEIRRDAFVAPPASPFGAMPSNAPPLPNGLEPEDAKWPVGLAYTPAIHALGNALFADTILSDPGVGRSCATCHIDTQGQLLTDSPNQFAQDINGNALPFNTPSLFNAAFGSVKTFEGHAASIEEQVRLPLENPLEMGNDDIDDVVARVNANQTYLAAFQNYLGGPATPETLSIALAMGIRARLLANAPFDMNPNTAASGRDLFFGKARCFTCHSGSNYSDDGFHNVRTVPATGLGSGVQGLIASTGRPADLGKIKTPSLRNLSKTGPYFHNGMAATLKQVVEHYNDPFNKLAAPITGDTKGVPDRDLHPLDLMPSEIYALELFLKKLSIP